MMHLYNEAQTTSLCGANVTHSHIVVHVAYVNCHLCLAIRLGSLRADVDMVEARLAGVLGISVHKIRMSS